MGTKASVIIVAWRLVAELQECLDALALSEGVGPFEVIIVLNGAPPATAKIAKSHHIVTRVITRNSNFGFGAACNVAASVANGANLVFLNDDTRVECDWLSALISTSERKPNAGAVASLLLNSDGTIQEAGSRVLSHGGTQQWGKGLSREEAEDQGLLRPRVVDYGSAAALLIRRSLFVELGGFDPLFEPAYYEDVDLQLRLREVGRSIWFEPAARVIHHSGLSTRSDQWFRWFAANRSGQRFIERWAEMLSTAPSPDSPVDYLGNVGSRMRPVVRTSVASVDIDDSDRMALAIANDYAAWLAAQLDQATNDVKALQQEAASLPGRDALVAEIAVLNERLQAQSAPTAAIDLLDIIVSKRNVRRGREGAKAQRIKLTQNDLALSEAVRATAEKTSWRWKRSF